MHVICSEGSRTAVDALRRCLQCRLLRHTAADARFFCLCPRRRCCSRGAGFRGSGPFCCILCHGLGTQTGIDCGGGRAPRRWQNSLGIRGLPQLAIAGSDPLGGRLVCDNRHCGLVGIDCDNRSLSLGNAGAKFLRPLGWNLRGRGVFRGRLQSWGRFRIRSLTRQCAVNSDLCRRLRVLRDARVVRLDDQTSCCCADLRVASVTVGGLALGDKSLHYLWGRWLRNLLLLFGPAQLLDDSEWHISARMGDAAVELGRRRAVRSLRHHARGSREQVRWRRQRGCGLPLFILLYFPHLRRDLRLLARCCFDNGRGCWRLRACCRLRRSLRWRLRMGKRRHQVCLRRQRNRFLRGRAGGFPLRARCRF
mmetsp:Transcript_73543/g.212834  ORF Transcript_73543/g.212834 Transcript_73543/m.212834 type:complete len:365 (-) Transcript_73543:1381-2475(-)